MLNTKNWELISTKSILNINISNEANNEKKNVLKNLRSNNSNKIAFGQININFLRKNFELLTEMVRDKVELLMISETKLKFPFQTLSFI